MMPLLHDAVTVAAKAAGTLAIAGVATHALRRGSAAVRHLVWTLAVTIAALLPVASVALPTWRVAVLPTSAPTAISAAQAQKPRMHIRVSDVEERDVSIAVPSHVESPAPLPAIAPSTIAVEAPERGPEASTVLLVVWAVGFAGVAATWVVGVAAAHRLGRRTPVVTEGPLFDSADALRRELSISRRIALHVGGATPLTWGALRPHLLLPASAADWPAERLRAVLLHELSHVRRHDCATQWLAQLCCCVHWFNPLAWHAAARMRVERERACDDAVLRHGEDPVCYADVLLAVASSGRRSGHAVGLPMARRSGLKGRVRTVLDGTVNRRPMRRRMAAMAGSIALVTLLMTAAVRLTTRPSRAQVSGAASTQPAVKSITVVGDSPKLQFLAWLGDDKGGTYYAKASSWRADGRPITSADLAEIARQVAPRVHSEGADTLCLWFADPALDDRSTVAVDVIDGAGRSLLSPANSTGSSVNTTGPGICRAAVSICLSRDEHRPATATVQLRYTSGPWTDGPAIATDPPTTTTESTPEGTTIYTADGQDRDGHAVCSLVQSGRRATSVQRSFSARTRDGRLVPCARTSTTGSSDVTMIRCTADLPLADVVAFVPQTRPVLTATFDDVPLAAGVVRPASRPATKPAAVATTAPAAESAETIAKALDHDILQRAKPDLRRATVARVRAMLAGDDPVEQAAALTAVWHTGEVPYDRAGMAPIVVRLLGSPSAAVRVAALGAVYAVRPDPATARPAIVRLADDPDPTVRSGVVGGLVGLLSADQQPEPIGEPVLKLLNDKDQTVVVETAERLWGLAVTPAVEAKVIALSRWPAAGPVPGFRSLQHTMMYYVRSTRPELSRPVAERLAEMAADARLDEDWHQRIIWGLGNHTATPESRDVIVKALVAEVDGSLKYEDRYWAVWGLGHIGTPAALAKVRAVAEGEESLQLKELARRFVPTTRP